MYMIFAIYMIAMQTHTHLYITYVKCQHTSLSSALSAATEWIGMSKRSWGACLAQLCGAAGQCLLAGMIFLVRDWRLAQIITAALHAMVAVYIW